MTERKRDWEVVTGWEKRIKVDFGSIGPNHVRWSDWTYKERDIVARKVHESALISEEHGPRSRKMEEWAKEHAPIMIDFARDHKPMPDWAHADYRESGVPEHVEVKWSQPDRAGPGEWVYSLPGPWDEGEEPAWSAPVGLPESGGMHSKFGGVISYKTMANGDHVATDGTVISTAESRAKEDVPDWRKFELGRLEDVDNVIVPGPNALPKDIERYGGNVKFTKRHKVMTPVKIMPDDPNHTPQEKALNWAAETHHGHAHQERWNHVAAALGADNGYEPMSFMELERQWERFNKNARWSMARDAMKPAEKEEDEPVEEIEGEWRLTPNSPNGKIPPKPGSTGWYTREIKWLPKWYWDLPAISDTEAKELGATSRASVSPRNFIYHKNGFGILGRQKPIPAREDLPIWTKDQAESYYRQKGIAMRSVGWIDGHLMQHKGYTDNGQGTGTFVARAADEEYEEAHKTCPVPNAMAKALLAGDWAEVARLAKFWDEASRLKEEDIHRSKGY